jgi:growth hormone-inducible transmembrane protein
LSALIAPLCVFVGPQLLARAALYTAGITAGLTSIAVTAPSEKFLNMAGPLAIGMGLVFASSIGAMFLPPTTTLGLSLYSVYMYGGLVLFSGLLLYDTQKITYKAEHSQHFDSVNESMSIYMDVLNIFIRLAMIMSGSRNKK